MSIRFDAADTHWRVAPLPGFTRDQKDWLTRGGSLTAHLRTLGAVVVRVTREAVAMPWADEHAALDVASRAPVWVREVVLSVDGIPYVAAHSIAPLAASVGVWQAMRRLRTRPLAELLYSDSSVARSSLVNRRLTARHPLYRLAACEIGAAHPQALVARRSVFERHGAPLMVTECMLPALWAHLASASPRSSAQVPHGTPRGHARSLEHTASRAHPVLKVGLVNRPAAERANAPVEEHGNGPASGHSNGRANDDASGRVNEPDVDSAREHEHGPTVKR